MSAQSDIDLSELWNPAFNEVWNEIAPYVIGRDARGDVPPTKYDELFLMGGRASGKSYFAAVVMWLVLENDPKKNGVVVRKVGSSIRKSCWKQMMRIRKRLGFFHWEPNKTDMTFTNTFTGQQIFMCGLDDEEKVRSIAVENGYISIIWFEEAKQFKNMEEIDQAVASVLRGGSDDDGETDYDDDGDQEYMTMVTYNPPKSARHWINQEARTRKKSRLVHKSTYLTMPRKWIGKKILSEIEQMKERNPTQYRHMYLGEITGTGLEYFTNIEIRKITKDEIYSFDYFNMGVDWGEIDPNVFLKTYIDIDKAIGYVFDGIYQDDYDKSCGKTKLQQFAEMVVMHTADCRDDIIWCDAQGKAEAGILSGRPYNLNMQFAPKQGDNGRLSGYSYMQKLRKLVLDKDLPEQVINEFVNFEARTLPDGTPIDEPGKKGDHSTDCFRYSENEAIREGSLSVDDDDSPEDDGDDEMAMVGEPEEAYS